MGAPLIFLRSSNALALESRGIHIYGGNSSIYAGFGLVFGVRKW